MAWWIGKLHGLQHLIEILVGRGRLILWIRAAVGQDIVGHEIVVHGFLIQSADGRFSTLASWSHYSIA
jgi:hypothetical protein